MRIINKAVLECVVIFDKKDLSVNGLGTIKFHGTLSLVDFIIKDRNLVMNAQLVLYDDGHVLKFVKSNIGKTVKDYNTFQKHIHEMNRLQISEIAELKKNESLSRVIVTVGELDEEDDIVSDVDGIIVIENKNEEIKNEQRNKTAKSNKKVCKGKNNSCSSRSTRRVKRKQLQ